MTSSDVEEAKAARRGEQFGGPVLSEGIFRPFLVWMILPKFLRREEQAQGEEQEDRNTPTWQTPIRKESKDTGKEGKKKKKKLDEEQRVLCSIYHISPF